MKKNKTVYSTYQRSNQHWYVNENGKIIAGFLSEEDARIFLKLKMPIVQGKTKLGNARD